MSHRAILSMVQIALFAAVLVILSQISIPTPWGVPFTLQTFAVALTAYALGWKRGIIAVAVYLMLGIVGIPVFSSFSGGIAKLVGITGGYLWGFLPMAALCGLGIEYWKKQPCAKTRICCVLLSAAGLASCHLPGVIQFALVSGSTMTNAFLVASLPYLLKDGVSLVLAFGLAIAIRRATHQLTPQQEKAD